MGKTVKKASESRVDYTELILPGETNDHGTLYGGSLMHKLDNVAAISFRRHTRGNGVTASMDNLNFIKPLPQSHSVGIEAYVTGTGTSSVEVFCKVIGENLGNGERYLAATAFLTFVVLPEIETGIRVEVPEVEAETAEEAYVMGGYQARRKERLKEREEDLDFQENLTID